MKANEAPEKIYLISDEDGVMLSYDSSAKLQYGNRYDFVDKEVFPIEEGCEVEYTRTDAFIEKACKKLEKCMYDNLMFQGRLHRKEVIETFIEDFKKAIEEGNL